MKAVFFDIGSTLVSGPNRGVAGRLADALALSAEEKAQVNAALMTENLRDPDEAGVAIADRLGRARDEVGPAVKRVWDAQLTEAHRIDGALASLDAWRAAGARLGLISNIWRPYQLSALEALGPDLADWAPEERRLYSYEFGAAKPDESLFAEALRRVGCAPEEALMVGDSYREDIAPAISLGLNTAWVLARPEREARNVAAIVNGHAAPPAATLLSIAEFTPERWREMTAGRSAARGRVPAEVVHDAS